MVTGERLPVRFAQTLSRCFVLADLWPDRSARNRGMDSGGSAAGAVPVADAQVHLDTDAARGLARSKVEKPQGAAVYNRRPANPAIVNRRSLKLGADTRGKRCHVA